MSRRRAAAALALVLATVPALTGCGDNDEGSHTTHTTMGPASSVDPADSLPEEAKARLATIEERGAPTVGAVEGEVTELKITDDEVGDGAEVTAESTVAIHYVGAAASTGEVFDSSWESSFATSPLAGFIPGWQQGLLGMKEGGRRTLVIPPDLAYGDGGPAPGDSLVFTVDLIAVLPAG
jgi:peptidylprolyl isomerase